MVWSLLQCWEPIRESIIFFKTGAYNHVGKTGTRLVSICYIASQYVELPL